MPATSFVATVAEGNALSHRKCSLMIISSMAVAEGEKNTDYYKKYGT